MKTTIFILFVLILLVALVVALRFLNKTRIEIDAAIERARKRTEEAAINLYNDLKSVRGKA